MKIKRRPGKVIHRANILREDGAILSFGKNICKKPFSYFIFNYIVSL